MSQNFFSSNSKLDQVMTPEVMTPEQFSQIVAAILAGKYSWACVLILRFAGYNPLHYLPYRTYKRLMKDNRQRGSSSGLEKHHRDKDQELSAVKSGRASSQRRSRQINDLSYLETVETELIGVSGGTSDPSHVRESWQFGNFSQADYETLIS